MVDDLNSKINFTKSRLFLTKMICLLANFYAFMSEIWSVFVIKLTNVYDYLNW